MSSQYKWRRMRTTERKLYLLKFRILRLEYNYGGFAEAIDSNKNVGEWKRKIPDPNRLNRNKEDIEK